MSDRKNREVINWFKIGMAVMLSLSVIALAIVTPATAAGEITAMRTLPDDPVSQGENFNVEIDALEYGIFGQVVETLPDGFTYVTSTLDPGSVEIVRNAVKFTLLAGEGDFTYTVTAPSTEGTYTFSGTLKDEERNEYPVDGDTEVIVGAGGSSSTPSPTVSIDPASTTVSPGDTFAVDVVVDSCTYNLTGCKVELIYNSSALEATNITEGTLFGSPALMEPGSGITDGLIHYGMSRATGEGNTPASASGTFITIEFEIKANASMGTYTLDLQNVELDDENNQSITGVGMNDGRVVVVSGPMLSPTPPAEETPTPTVSPTATPTITATPAPTAAPTATPTPTPTEEVPGFGAVFAIAGLFAVAYLVLQRRKA